MQVLPFLTILATALAGQSFNPLIIRSGSDYQYASLKASGSDVIAGYNDRLQLVLNSDGSLIDRTTMKYVHVGEDHSLTLSNDVQTGFSFDGNYLAYNGRASFAVCAESKVQYNTSDSSCLGIAVRIENPQNTDDVRPGSSETTTIYSVVTYVQTTQPAETTTFAGKDKKDVTTTVVGEPVYTEITSNVDDTEPAETITMVLKAKRGVVSSTAAQDDIITTVIGEPLAPETTKPAETITFVGKDRKDATTTVVGKPLGPETIKPAETTTFAGKDKKDATTTVVGEPVYTEITSNGDDNEPAETITMVLKAKRGVVSSTAAQDDTITTFIGEPLYTEVSTNYDDETSVVSTQPASTTTFAGKSPKDIVSSTAAQDSATTTVAGASPNLAGTKFTLVAIHSGSDVQNYPIKKVAEHPLVFSVGGADRETVTLTFASDSSSLADQDGRGVSLDQETGELGNVAPFGRQPATTGFSIDNGDLTYNGDSTWKACPSDNGYALSHNDCTGGITIELKAVYA